MLTLFYLHSIKGVKILNKVMPQISWTSLVHYCAMIERSHSNGLSVPCVSDKENYSFDGSRNFAFRILDDSNMLHIRSRLYSKPFRGSSARNGCYYPSGVGCCGGGCCDGEMRGKKHVFLPLVSPSLLPCSCQNGLCALILHQMQFEQI